MKLIKQSKFALSLLLIVAVLISGILPLSVFPVKADEYVAPDNMLHICSSTAGPLMQRVEVVPGGEYYFSFGISNNSPDFNVIGLDKDRENISINPNEISKTIDGKYTRYIYSLTIPTDLPVQSGKYRAFIGLAFGEYKDIYVFDFSLADGIDSSNILKNNKFEEYLDDWAWGKEAWFTSTQTGKKKTEWSNSTTSIKIEAFDISKFGSEEPAPKKDQMLYFKSKNKGPLMTRINFVSGANYNISFGITNNMTSFDIVAKTDGERNNISINETLVSKDNKGKYTIYKYSFTFPSSIPDGLAFIGFTFPANSEGYIFDIELTKADDTQNQLFSNGNFESGLDHWAWDWDAWFESWGNGKGLTQFSNANVQLNTCDFDEDEFDFEIPVIPEEKKDQMLYFKGKNKGPLMTRLKFVSGATYYISFGITNNITEFDIVAKTDDDRNGIGINETLVSKEEKAKYTNYLYEFTFPSSRPDGLAFIGFAFPINNCEGYIFDIKLIKKDDDTQKQLISNGDFKSGLDHWAWDWDAWFESWGNGIGKDKFSNTNVELEVLDFDETKFTLEAPLPLKDQMLYFENANSGPLMTRVSLTPGEKYYFSFYTSQNVVGTKLAVLNDDNRSNLSVNAKLLVQEEKNKHTYYKYEFTVPENFKLESGKTTGLAFVGVKFISGYDGYFYKAKLERANDTEAKQMLSNGDFSAGLDSWAWDWDAWFVSYPGHAGTGKKEWKNENIKLAVMDFDEDKFSTEKPDIPVSEHRMLQFKNGANPTPFSARVSVSPGKTFILSYSAFCTDETGLIVQTDDDRKTINVNEELISSTVNEQYTTYQYRFTIPNTYEGDLAFIGINIPYYAEGYLFDLSCYAEDDAQKTSVWKNADFMSYLDSWIWGWHAWFGMGTDENSYLKPSGMMKWSNGIDEIKILDFDLSKIDILIADINRDDGVWWNEKDYSENEMNNENGSGSLGKARLSGTFIVDSETPICNVKMILKSESNKYIAYTDNSGKFSFNNILEGNYELLFENSKKEEKSTGFFEFIEAGDNISISLTSDTTALLEELLANNIEYFDGNVYTPQLSPVSNIKIYMRGFGEAKTDSKGHFEFANIPEGEYELYTILPSGEEYIFRKVELQKNVKLSVKLKYDVPSATGSKNFFFSNKIVIILIPIVAGAVLIAGAVTVFLIIKKKKK